MNYDKFNYILILFFYDIINLYILLFKTIYYHVLIAQQIEHRSSNPGVSSANLLKHVLLLDY